MGFGKGEVQKKRGKNENNASWIKECGNETHSQKILDQKWK